MKLIFATNNQHKVDEIRIALPKSFSIISLREAGIDIDIPEPYATLEENAAQKAKIVHRLTDSDCFGEDTGLEVYSINNEPGVHSARYAGSDKSFQKNIEKLLNNLKDAKDRSAQFRTIICLCMNEDIHNFEGICLGRIVDKQKGANGFGYDPVFIPDGAKTTFAQMSLQEKSHYSHRKKALDKLVAFLKQ